jgi:hypothetical protein
MPDFHQTFHFGQWRLQPSDATLHLSYVVEGAGEMTEVLTFPAFEVPTDEAHRQALKAACRLLHWLAGVSYVKMGLPRKIHSQGVPPDCKTAGFLHKTWRNGLAELAYIHGISLNNRLEIDCQNTIPDNWRLRLPHRSLVPFGGGKDSIVTVEQLKKSHKPMRLFVVGNSPVIAKAAAKTGVPVYQVLRQLDEKLLKAPPEAYFNGHVPVTAINSAIAVVAALLHGYDSIVFSNERSAECHSTTDADGQPVNHQYSKSLQFERDFQAQIHRTISPDLRYFSLQRPWSELAILKNFSQYPDYFNDFTSCNRNFHLQGSRNKDSLWCGNCPKCRFVFLGLAPFIDKDRLLQIFGHNLLDDPKQMPGFEELLGVRGIKPFECVGEVTESRVAFNWLKNTPEWANDHVVRFLANKVVPTSAREEKDVLDFHAEHEIPPEFLPHQVA